MTAPATPPLDYRIFVRMAENLRAIDPARGFFGHVDDAAVRLDGDSQASQASTASPLIVVEPSGSERWEYEPGQQALSWIGARISWLEDVAPEEPIAGGAPVATDDDERLLRFWKACADIARALVADDPTLGGLVTDIRITDRRWSRQAYEGQTVVAEVDVLIQVRRDFTTPGGY